MNSPTPPYTLIDLASEELPIPGPDGERITEYRIPSVLTRAECVGKFHRGCPSPSLLPIFYACLESIARPLMPATPPVRKLSVFPGRDSAMVEWAVEIARLAGELVYGVPSTCLYFPGTHYGHALRAIIDASKSGRPIVLYDFDLLSHLESINQHQKTMEEKNLPFSVAPDLYRQDDPPADAFAHHLMQIIEIADGDREELTLQTQKGEISLKRHEVRPGFHVAAAYVAKS